MENITIAATIAEGATIHLHNIQTNVEGDANAYTANFCIMLDDTFIEGTTARFNNGAVRAVSRSQLALHVANDRIKNYWRFAKGIEFARPRLEHIIESLVELTISRPELICKYAERTDIQKELSRIYESKTAI